MGDHAGMLDVRIRAIQEVAYEILIRDAYKATKYIGDKLTVKATRKLYKGGWKKKDNVDIVLTIGKPNYEERKFIKGVKEMGMAFPLNQLTIKSLPKIKGGK